MPLSDPDDLEQSTLRALAGFAGQRVVEIGSGDGRLAWTLASEAALWLALDTDLSELSQAVEDRAANRPAPVHLAAGDGRALALPAGCCDLAFFAWSLC
jgi:ubiquinone/menaquinone biosynthesis C-methylase UbiE